MYDPVVLHITRAYPQAAVTRRAPFWPSYPLAYAHRRQYVRHPQFGAVWQTYDAHDAYISSLEIRASQTLQIPLTCPCADVHWIYVLEGTVTLHRPHRSNTPSSLTLHASAFIVCYSAPAAYQLQVAMGNTLILYYCIKASWLLRSETGYQAPLRPLLRALRHQSSHAVHTAVFPISLTVHTMLRLLASLPNADSLATDVAIYSHVTQLAELSRTALVEQRLSNDNQGTQLLLAVRRYIRERIGHGPTPRVREIAEAFGVSQQRLNHLHRLRYGHSLKPYLTRIRMETALQLLHQGHSPTEVAYRLDYTDLSTFSNQFKAYHGFSPMAAQP